ncbi:MAG TPA: 50S ribosomal protein L24 [Firmicutes bacterium]|nr:50S ribosomal protein L24 [Bacillota bacterium]
MSLNVKKGDNVVILAGKDKGRTGKIVSVNTSAGRVVVDGANEITKHVKARSANQQSRIEKKSGTIDASNVMILCPACNKATRVANKVEGGKKIRVCQKCGAALDVKAEKNDKKEKKTKTAAAESTGTSAKKTRKSKKTEEAQA